MSLEELEVTPVYDIAKSNEILVLIPAIRAGAIRLVSDTGVINTVRPLIEVPSYRFAANSSETLTATTIEFIYPLTRAHWFFGMYLQMIFPHNVAVSDFTIRVLIRKPNQPDTTVLPSTSYQLTADAVNFTVFHARVQFADLVPQGAQVVLQLSSAPANAFIYDFQGNYTTHLAFEVMKQVTSSDVILQSQRLA